MMSGDPFRAFDSHGTGLQLPAVHGVAAVRAIFVVLLLVVLLRVFWVWPYSRNWGYSLAAGAGLLLLIFLGTDHVRLRLAPDDGGCNVSQQAIELRGHWSK